MPRYHQERQAEDKTLKKVDCFLAGFSLEDVDPLPLPPYPRAPPPIDLYLLAQVQIGLQEVQ